MILEMLMVAGLASFEVYAAIPAGLALQLSPWAIFAASVAGGFAGVFLVAFLGERLQSIIPGKKKEPKEEKPKTGLIYRIWNRYGVIGLGFLGTITLGAPISIAVGVACKAPLRALVIWCCAGVIARCALFTTIGHYGAKLV